jgi:hypothetical protein
MTLTPNQLLVLSAVERVTALPGFGDHLVVVGSYGRGTFNQRSNASDLDVFVCDALVPRIWDVIAEFARLGIVSRWRVAGRLDIRGVSTAQHTAHPLSLTLGGAEKETKDRNLDLIVPARALRDVPGALRWMQSPHEPTGLENHRKLHRRDFGNFVSGEAADAMVRLRRRDERFKLFVAATDDAVRKLRTDTRCCCAL